MYTNKSFENLSPQSEKKKKKVCKFLKTALCLWAALERWVQLTTKPAEKLCFGPAKWSPLSVCVCVCLHACVCLTEGLSSTPCTVKMQWHRSTLNSLKVVSASRALTCVMWCDMNLNRCPTGVESFLPRHSLWLRSEFATKLSWAFSSSFLYMPLKPAPPFYDKV